MYAKLLLISYLNLASLDGVDLSFLKDDFIRKEFANAAIELQILDEQEHRYVMTEAKDISIDMSMMRERYQKLKTAPLIEPLKDLTYIQNDVNQGIKFNRAFAKYLNSQIELYPNDYYGKECEIALKETESLYRFWDSYRDAKSEFYYISVRRQGLKRAINEIGQERFDNKDFPPFVPVWRFREMKH